MDDEQKYKLEPEAGKEIDFEYKSLKRKLFIKKIISRLVVLLFLLILVYLFFIRKKTPKPPVENLQDQVVVEDVVVEDINNELNEEKPDTKELFKIPEVSPVVEPTTNNTNKQTSKNLSNVSPLRFEGTIAGQGDDLIFYSCSENEALLVLPSSPYYNYIYTRYNSLRIGSSIYGKIPVVFMGRKLPVVYQGLGSIYNQGFYIDAVIDIDSRGICT